jgi:hypothetical protein
MIRKKTELIKIIDETTQRIKVRNSLKLLSLIRYFFNISFPAFIQYGYKTIVYEITKSFVSKQLKMITKR